MPYRMPGSDADQPARYPADTGSRTGWAAASRLVDREVSWLAPTVALLQQSLPAGPAHPLFVPIALYGKRSLLDRVLLLAYLQRVQARFPHRLGDPEPADLVAWVHRVLRPAEPAFLARCLTGGVKYGPPDEELAAMTMAFGMQTCRRVANRVAGTRFALPAGSPLIEDLAVEMSARCLPMPQRLRRRKNARDGYFVTYTPEKSFEAYLDRFFRGGELEGVLKSYGRARNAEGESREIVLPDLLDFDVEDETEAIRSDQQRIRERVASFEPPTRVLRHFEHPADGRKRSCCDEAARWVTDARARIGGTTA